MALPATDTFTGAAGNLPNPPWTDQAAGGATVSLDGSGHFTQSALDGSDCFAFWNQDVFPNDHYSQITIGPIGSQWYKVLARAKDTGVSAFDNYDFFTDGSSGAGNSQIQKWVNGTPTAIANVTMTAVNGDTIKIDAVGNQITCYKNGSVVGGPYTDSSLTTGSAGIGCSVNPGGTLAGDNFEGGAVAAVAVDTTPKAPFPRNRLLFPSQPFSRCNPVVEMKWYDFGAASAVPVNTLIGLDVASTFTPGLAESETYGLSLAAVSSFVAGLIRTAAYQRALSVASGWAIALSRGVGYLRTLSVAGTWTPTVGRGVSYLRSLAVSSTFVPAITRARAVTLAVASTFTAALSRAVAYGKSLSVASTFVASLSRQAARAKTLAVGSTFGVALARQVAYLRTLSVSSVMTAAIARTRGYARAIAAASVFVPAVGIRYIVGKVMVVGSTFTAAIARQFAWTRALAVSSIMTPAVNRSVVHRITMAIGSVFSTVLQWLFSQFGHDTSALTGKVRAYPRLTGVAAACPRLAGNPRAYARLSGTAVGYARLVGVTDARPRLQGVVRVYPKAA